MAVVKKSQVIIDSLLVTVLLTLMGLLIIENISLKYVIGIFWVVPLVWLATKYNLYHVMVVTVISTLIILSRGLNIKFIIFLWQFIPPVLLIYFIINRGYSTKKGLVLTSLFSFFIIGLLIMTEMFYYRSVIQSTKWLFENSRIKNISLLIPGILTINYLLDITIIYIVAKKVIKRDEPFDLSFSTWYAPWYFIWAVIVGLFITLIGDIFGFKGLLLFGINFLLVVVPFFLAMGILVITHFLKRWKWNLINKILLITIVVLYPQIIFMFILLLGVFDPYFDFRGLNKSNDVGRST